jgi:hypothetical protein
MHYFELTSEFGYFRHKIIDCSIILEGVEDVYEEIKIGQ